MYKGSAWLSLLFGIAVCPAMAQTGSGNDDAKALAVALQKLDGVASIDQIARRYQQDLAAILSRVCEQPEEATPSEHNVANVLLPQKGSGGKYNFGHARGLVPPDLVHPLDLALNRMPGIAWKPVFQAGSRRTPLRKIGYVSLQINKQTNTLVDVDGSPDIEQRVQVIRKRLADVSKMAPLWWTRLTVRQKNGEYVVASPDAPGGFLITADESFAHARNTSPKQLAYDLIREIRSTFDAGPGQDINIRARSLQSLPPDVIRRMAVQARAKGDSAYDRHDLTTAEENYQSAISYNPDYVLAYEMLAGVYAEEGHQDQAREQLQKALALSSLSDQDRQDIQSQLSRLPQN